MHLKTTSLLLGLSMLAACTSTPHTSTTSTGGGATGVASTATTAAVPGSHEDFVHTAGDRVFFAYDRHDLSHEAQSVLQRQAEWLKKYPHTKVVMEGHCDERGTREYNLALGERRANTAKHYLKQLGVDEHRVEVISYGKERPFVAGSNEESWAQNRVARAVVQ